MSDVYALLQYIFSIWYQLSINDTIVFFGYLAVIIVPN